jgi:predicted nuclease with TOPRIM domain
VVKAQLDEEIASYKDTKDKLSNLRRNNFVLWKHIKKLKRKYRKLRVDGIKSLEERWEEVSDEDELDQLK